MAKELKAQSSKLKGKDVGAGFIPAREGIKPSPDQLATRNSQHATDQ